MSDTRIYTVRADISFAALVQVRASSESEAIELATDLESVDIDFEDALEVDFIRLRVDREPSVVCVDDYATWYAGDPFPEVPADQRWQDVPDGAR